MRRAPVLIAGVAVLAATLAGCAGLPSSGTVNAGHPVTAAPENPSFDFRPGGPAIGATPQQIVDGFLNAASGPEQNWAVAQTYLTAQARAAWNPRAGVTVDVFGSRAVTQPEEGVVDLQTTPAGTVDAAGVFAPADGDRAAVRFRLERTDTGEWRISQAPDGLLLDEDLFRRVFHAYPVMFFDPTHTFLVPDVRWFPALNAPARIADALNGPPAPWLADSVVSAFPPSIRLTPAVPVSGTAARVEVSAAALDLDQVTLDRMQTQLVASLASAGVTDAVMVVDGAQVTASRVATRDTKVDGRALVLTDAGFGFLLSGELTPVPGLSEVIPSAAPVSLVAGADRTQAAARLPDGTAVRIAADGSIRPVDRRPGLVDPSLDPFGGVWTVPREDPAAVTVEVGGETVAVGGWRGATQIDAMQVSRDGSRVAAVVGYGAGSAVVAAGVVRDAAGAPTALGEWTLLGVLPARGTALAWLDGTTVGVLAGSGEDAVYVEQPVGGLPVVAAAPPGAVSLAGSSSAASVRLRDAAGTIYVRRSATWIATATGVTVLAIQQGSPAS